jgi:hypothetical protein
MAKMIIKVPKTPKSAFDKNRPASDLLKAQLEHLEAAVGNYRRRPPAKRKRGSPLTEGQVAILIHELTRRLHPLGAAARSASTATGNPIEEPFTDSRTPAKAVRGTVKKSKPRKGGRKTRRRG